MIQVVTFTWPRTNTSEDGVAAMRLRDIVDQLHDDNGFANACAAEQADLAAFRIGGQQVDELNARNELRCFCGLLDAVGRITVNR